MQITIPQMCDIIEHIALRMGEPILFEGQPGVGKTEGITQTAKKLDAHLCDIRLSLYDSVDLRGIPDIEKQKNGTAMTTWHIPSTVPFIGNPLFPKDRLILMFMDELGSMQPAVEPVAMQLINENAVGENKLMPNVRIIAATNSSAHRGTSRDLTTTTYNRFTHFEVVVAVLAWCEWALKNLPPSVAPLAYAYYQFKEGDLNTFDPSKRGVKAFATPRTSEKGWRYMADDQMPEWMKRAALEGVVGVGPAAGIWEFVRIYREVLKPKEIIADPLGVPLPSRGDIKYATVVSASGAMTGKNADKIGAFLKRFRDADPELETLGWTLASRRTDNTKDDVTTANAYFDWAKQLKHVFA